ncbi:hypothetical protein BDZ89DRAFT_1055739 [Hymenopellis radicata]|nr:hypothetical protein BDZ89DRAFT_1055739 [Hymenopellis radicata]
MMVSDRAQRPPSEMSLLSVFYCFWWYLSASNPCHSSSAGGEQRSSALCLALPKRSPLGAHAGSSYWEGLPFYSAVHSLVLFREQ